MTKEFQLSEEFTFLPFILLLFKDYFIIKWLYVQKIKTIFYN